MQRRITGFFQDDEQVWVAELECGHEQHIRHEPPWQLRPWVLTEKGRHDFLGARLGCPLCNRRELPKSAQLIRRTDVFDENSIPAGLQSKHDTKPGVWAAIHVLDGELALRLFEPFDKTKRVRKGKVSMVPPGVVHKVYPRGRVQFFVELLRTRPRDVSDSSR